MRKSRFCKSSVSPGVPQTDISDERFEGKPSSTKTTEKDAAQQKKPRKSRLISKIRQKFQRNQSDSANPSPNTNGGESKGPECSKSYVNHC